MSYLLTPCCFINFCHLINLPSSFQTSVIFSPFVIYSLFTSSTHPINAPAVHTTNTTLTFVLSCARSLCQYTFLTHQASLVIVPFRCGGIEAWLGGFSKNNLLPSEYNFSNPSTTLLQQWIFLQFDWPATFQSGQYVKRELILNGTSRSLCLL